MIHIGGGIVAPRLISFAYMAAPEQTHHSLELQTVLS